MVWGGTPSLSGLALTYRGPFPARDDPQCQSAHRSEDECKNIRRNHRHSQESAMTGRKHRDARCGRAGRTTRQKIHK
jgi:hypothetical protein